MKKAEDEKNWTEVAIDEEKANKEKARTDEMKIDEQKMNVEKSTKDTDRKEGSGGQEEV